MTLAMLVLHSCQTYTQGERLYQLHCANCHGTNGEGLALLYPPLQGSAFLNDSIHQLPCIIKNGKISFDSLGIKNIEMPAITELNEIQLFNLINYVHHTFVDQKIDLHPDSLQQWSNDCL